MTVKTIHIFDIDGVLLDSSHRYRIKDNRKIDLEHWRTNCVQSEINKDSALPMATIYKKLLHRPSSYVILATAREITKHDINSIHKLLGLPQHFIYRKRGDSQSGTRLKLKGLRKILSLRQFKDKPRFFYEDNLDYLYPVAKAINATPFYIHSNQGF